MEHKSFISLRMVVEASRCLRLSDGPPVELSSPLLNFRPFHSAPLHFVLPSLSNARVFLELRCRYIDYIVVVLRCACTRSALFLWAQGVFQLLLVGIAGDPPSIGDSLVGQCVSRLQCHISTLVPVRHLGLQLRKGQAQAPGNHSDFGPRMPQETRL